MDSNFQKSIVPIDEEELKFWNKLPETTSNSEASNHNDYLVYTDPDGKQYYLHKRLIAPF